jgi:hypothetical protein
MSKKRYKRHTPEEIVAYLRQVDVLASQGMHDGRRGRAALAR